MNYLSNNSIISEVTKIRPGTMFRIGYTTQVPVAAAHKNMGCSITKVVLTTVRTGVKYDNISAVIKKRAELEGEVKPERKYTNPFEYTIPNRVCRHITNGTEYLCLATVKNSNTFTQYIVHDAYEGKTVVLTAEEFLASKYREFPIPSYFNKRETEWFRVSFDNIYRIRGVEA